MSSLHELIKVDATSPSGLRWVKPQARRCKPGDVAGSLRKCGYYMVTINSQRQYAHRIVWELTYGPVPAGMEIDHIDRNPSNNNIGNLRVVSSSGNNYNQKIRVDNKTGTKGVYFCNTKQKFKGQVKYAGNIYTATFNNQADAVSWVTHMRKEFGLCAN